MASAAPVDLDATYSAIAAAQPEQQAAYEAWVASDAVDAAALTAQAAALGLTLDIVSGTIAYAPDFESKRLALDFDLLYCRHGKTTGNTEPRVYQGYVDEPSNALNEIGLAQAEDAADLLDELAVEPDLIVLSPLARAADTGEAWVARHAPLRMRVETWDDTAEMRFGDWDNVMVKDMPETSICHLFYLAQNAVVKSGEPYVAPSGGESYDAENFVEVLERAHAVLAKLNGRAAALRAAVEEGDWGVVPKPPLVVMYGHSMMGAAIGVLTGNGKTVDGEAFLGFDGKYILPNATPVYLAKQGGGAGY